MGTPLRQVLHGPMARTSMLLYIAPMTKTLHKMDLRAVGMVGRIVKSTADRQCHHEAGIWPEHAADFLVEGLEVDSEEGVASQLQRRFHHEIDLGYFVFALCALLVYG